MDVNKKIEIINNLKNVLHQDIFEEVVEAMQKQIPMAPGHWICGDNGCIVFPCGRCGSDLSGDEEYCKWCGQKVKWV